MNLDSKYAGIFNRPQCHEDDAEYHHSTFLSGKKDVSGGWHDAGDYGKYVHNSAATLGIMLLGYEYFPKKFQSDNEEIDESGNGIPDFLDECRYQLEWILKMQDQDEGLVHYMINTKNYASSMPHQDVQRYIYGYASVATGGFAAITAMAARIYEPYDKDFSDKLLDAAKLAWQALETYPVIFPTGGFVRPSDTYTGGYASSGAKDGQDADERLWASTELFITTGEQKYKDYTDNVLKTSTTFSDNFDWMTVYSYPKYSYMLSEESYLDQEIREKLKSKFIQSTDYMLAKINDDGFYSALQNGEYVWGSTGHLLSKGIRLIFAYELTNDIKYYNAALKQLNYILGINGLNLCFVAKTGTKYPENIHHAALASDNVDDIYPGLMPGGPNQYGGDAVLSGLIAAETPSALCYKDTYQSYGSNENCIFYSAPLVFVAGYFSQDKHMTSVTSNENIEENEFSIKNYPNPFNNSTKIFFKMGFEDEIDFVIYDLLGRKIFKKSLGVLSSGNHTANWNGKNESGQEVSSGIYVYSINSKKFGFKTGKMILLK